MPKLLDDPKVPRMSPHELRPNSGTPAPAPMQWVVHQSPLPWINSVSLWPLGQRTGREERR